MKSMRVPVLVFETPEDVDIILKAMNSWNEVQHEYDKNKVQEKINEIYKIKQIFDNTNNN